MECVDEQGGRHPILKIFAGFLGKQLEVHKLVCNLYSPKGACGVLEHSGLGELKRLIA